MLTNFGSMTSTVANIASYFTVPTIGGLYYKKTDMTKTGAFVNKVLDFFKIGIPVYPDSYEEIGGNMIGEQVLVGGVGASALESVSNGDAVTGALVKIADNIVVTPRTWNIHGYTGFKQNSFLNTAADAGAAVATFGASHFSAFLGSFVRRFGRETVNLILKKVIRYIAESRKPFKFTTSEGETVPCLIKSYKITSSPENQNFVELTLELQEFRFLAITTGLNQIQIGGVTGLWQSAADAASQLSRSALKVIAI